MIIVANFSMLLSYLIKKIINAVEYLSKTISRLNLKEFIKHGTQQPKNDIIFPYTQ